MKIRRFVAADMRAALQLVREAHGPDAVILSNRRTDEGIEIVAASNYDENFVQRAIEDTRQEDGNAGQPAQQAAPAPAPVAGPAPAPAPAPAAGSADATPAASERPLAPSERWLNSLSDGAGPSGTGPMPAPASAPDAGAAPATTPAPAPAPASASATPAATRPAPEAEPRTALAGLVDAGSRIDGPTFAELLAAGQGAHAAPAADGNPSPRVSPLTPVPDAPAASDGEMSRLREELAQMRQMIEREMVRLTDERLRGSPVRAQAMDLMEDYGFDAGITRDVVLQIPADTAAPRARGLMLGLISKRLPICPVDPLHEAGVIALVGPTGAGKTTTIAKLAALYASRHQPRDVALVTTDTVRVGGREQLHSYGRELGIAVHEADSEAGLLQLLQRLQDYKLVLVVTAGLS